MAGHISVCLQSEYVLHKAIFFFLFIIQIIFIVFLVVQ